MGTTNLNLLEERLSHIIKQHKVRTLRCLALASSTELSRREQQDGQGYQKQQRKGRDRGTKIQQNMHLINTIYVNPTVIPLVPSIAKVQKQTVLRRTGLRWVERDKETTYLVSSDI